jgi:hypothetical protein
VFCRSCRAPLAAGARFCASCGTPVTEASAAPQLVDDATKLVEAPTELATPSAGARKSPPRSPSSGWLTSSGSISHGKFEPGAVLDGRYRIIGLLGKGGMGAVYRADDLRLGQPVALKFLPPDLSRDAAQLAQFHNEVRTARQVSHANVCRVYDVGEIDGQLYLSMEYVDGEDLASSLRRIGRFAEDKALDIARQLCAGVAAAHQRGIVHRDLKPANVMLDGAGKVRVMDFGLATAGHVDQVRVGTPAYMAPEQLEGREVTARSDIFALGLILYELFTGRRALAGPTIDDLQRQHESGTITTPTAIVKTLDPAVERAILRCLDRDPARRPASALGVAAALPGGDPLAAALAAGETPSPEVVAAAGGESAAMSWPTALACFALVMASLWVSFHLAGRFLDLNQVRFDLEPRVLEDRARTFEQSVGVGANVVDRASGLFVSTDIQNWIASLPEAPVRDAIRHAGWPSAIVFWHRSSPRLLVPSVLTPRPGRGDPPLLLSGMTLIGLASSGQLIEFMSVPVQVESRATAPRLALDWGTFFRAAGLDQARFSPVPPDWTPRVYADARHAWLGTAPGIPGDLRVEAASHRGVPVSFQIIGPWARPTRMEAPGTRGGADLIAIVASVIIVPGTLLAAAWLARRNLRLGRADRRGAAAVAAFVVTMRMVYWLLVARHFADAVVEQNRFFAALAGALLEGGISAVLYLAIEPALRRARPQMLITWSRLLAGRIRDPMFGRDLLIGAAAGTLLTAITYAHYLLAGAFGRGEFTPASADLSVLLGMPLVVAAMINPVQSALQNAFLGALGLVLVRMVVRKTWLTFAIPVAVFSFLAARGQFETGIVWLDLALGAVLVAIILGTILRFGLVAGAAGFTIHFLTTNLPLTFDMSRPYAGLGLWVGAVVVGVAVAGMLLATSTARAHFTRMS